MALADIKLDDRRFEDLVAEARRRIPGYTPEWTDHNDSDPGMTLVHLFAWLAEMILWRLNRVPDKNFVKFLELIGIELRPPTPAQAELSFTLSAPDLDQGVLVPKGTRVVLAEQADATPVIFETDDNLLAVAAAIGAFQSFDGAQYELVSESNRLARQFFYPFGARPQKGSALYVGLTRPFPRGRHTITIHAYTEGLTPGGANAPVTQAPPVSAVWEYWAGDTWRALSVVENTTVALTRTGTVTFDAPVPPNQMAIATDGLGLLKRPEDPRLYWLRYRIDEVLGPGFEIAPRLEDVLLNTIKATNAVTVRDELLGPSDGRPDQRFKLQNAPVLAESLILEVQESLDQDFQLWQQVHDFGRSGPEDRHYTLNPVTGEIAFGDGKKGKIPPMLPDLRPNPAGGGEDTRPANIRTSVYRWGGGARGNAGPDKITALESVIPFVESVTNLRPAAGGEDEETLEQAKSRAPREIRTRSRAVTADDFEFLAQQTPGTRIRRAKSLPLHHPRLEPRRPAGAGQPVTLVPVPGVVTVLVVPESRDPQPVLREETRNLVASYLDQFRLITTEVYVEPARYRKVEVEVRVLAKPDADSAAVQKALQERLLRYFHPLTGGDKGDGWEFGGTIYFSETYRQILTTDGVMRVEADAMKTYLDGIEQAACEDIPLGGDELVWSDVHQVEVRYE